MSIFMVYNQMGHREQAAMDILEKSKDVRSASNVLEKICETKFSESADVPKHPIDLRTYWRLANQLTQQIQFEAQVCMGVVEQRFQHETKTLIAEYTKNKETA